MLSSFRFFQDGGIWVRMGYIFILKFNCFNISPSVVLNLNNAIMNCFLFLTNDVLSFHNKQLIENYALLKP